MKKLRLTQSMCKKIIVYATNSFYRMNALTATGYGFTLYREESGKLNWRGGYIWRDVFDGEDYKYDFHTKHIFSIENKIIYPKEVSNATHK